MYSGPLVFTQVMDFLPMKTFRRCVDRYQGNFAIKHFTCLDQFRAMAFAQLTYRESLRDIEACLRAQANKLYHMGIRAKVSRSTLADANENRDWRIYADLAHSLIPVARKLYQDEDFGVELDQTVYALDATTIDLMSVTVSMGSVSQGQRSHQTPYPARSAWQHPDIYPYLRRQGTRRQHPGRSDCRGRGLLCHGSWLSRLLPSVSSDQGLRLLRHSRQEEPGLSAALFKSGGSQHRLDLRPNGRADRPEFFSLLSGQTASHQAAGHRVRQNSGLLDQQLRLASRRPLPNCIAAAGRSNCSSNGSSSTCASRPSTAPARMPSKPRYGSQSRSTC